MDEYEGNHRTGDKYVRLLFECALIYYIDKSYNVYQAEDIIINKLNPKIIAKYIKNGDVYSIPEFNI